MLSFFSSKPAAAKSDALPEIVDFNTIESNSSGKEERSPPGFSFWPFGSKLKSPAESANNNEAFKALLIDPKNKVISMKKIDSSILQNKQSGLALPETKNTATSKVYQDDEEFIDIQLRQLSYAEVAALDLLEQRPRSQKFIETNAKHSKQSDGMVVIDQEKDLGKSISDLEMVESFKNFEKNNHVGEHLSTLNDMNTLSPEDEWDLYNEEKVSKKLKRSQKIKKRESNKKHHS